MQDNYSCLTSSSVHDLFLEWLTSTTLWNFVDRQEQGYGSWCCKESGRGMTKCIIWDEVTDKNLQTEVQDTTKAAVLEGDSECTNIVAFSIYDTKPVDFLSACTSLQWEKQRNSFVQVQGWIIHSLFLAIPYSIRCKTINFLSLIASIMVRSKLKDIRWWKEIQAMLINTKKLTTALLICIKAYWKQLNLLLCLILDSLSYHLHFVLESPFFTLLFVKQ